MVVSLRELTDGNRAAVLALRVAPEQEKFVGASVQNALADAADYPDAKPWYQVVYAGEAVPNVLTPRSAPPPSEWSGHRVLTVTPTSGSQARWR